MTGRLWDLCLGFLLAAVMVFVAVQLLAAIVWWLVGIAAVVAAGYVALQLLRAWRDRFW